MKTLLWRKNRRIHRCVAAPIGAATQRFKLPKPFYLCFQRNAPMQFEECHIPGQNTFLNPHFYSVATITKQGTWATFMCKVHETDASAYSDAAVLVRVISRRNFNKGFYMEFGNNNMTYTWQYRIPSTNDFKTGITLLEKRYSCLNVKTECLNFVRSILCIKSRGWKIILLSENNGLTFWGGGGDFLPNFLIF